MVDVCHRRVGRDLDRVKALFHALFRVGCGLFGRVAAGMAVHADLVTAAAAQQLIHRRAELLALDIPKRLLDTADAGGQDGAAAIESRAVHGLPEVFNAHGVRADEHRAQFVDRHLDRASTAFQHGFAPADDALVGRDLQEHPSGLDMEGFQVCDLHKAFPFLFIR